jgi:hypothetical protein
MTKPVPDAVDWLLPARPECFVIQPFDGGEFDKRYEDVYEGAIEAAGLTPYRVDRDPSAAIPIDHIAERIRSAAACFADITDDNPNVWFELGFAIAAKREVAIVCSDRRTKFPFDVQHRNIITYRTQAPRDFEDLRSRITSRLIASLSREQNRGIIDEISPVQATAGLSPHEQVLLVCVAQRMDSQADSVSTYLLRQDMQAYGFNDLAVVLSTRSLTKRGLIATFREADYNSNEYTAHRVTEEGFEWLERNQDRLTLKVPPEAK